MKHIENNANRKIRIVNRNKNPNKLINPYTDINKSNSARSIFIKKYIQNKFSNSFNNISNENYTFNTQNEKTSYIYKKKI